MSNANNSPRLLAFAGSLRKDSLNRRLVRVLAEAARDEGADVTLIELRDYPLPVYDGDIEAAGMPDNVRALQKLMGEHDGLLIATPEYNGSVPALVKNTLDWISRPQINEESGTALFRGKVAGICSASPGALGGLRALIVLRDMLSKLGLWVAPTQTAIGHANTLLDNNGALNNKKQHNAIIRVATDAVAASKAFSDHQPSVL